MEGVLRPLYRRGDFGTAVDLQAVQSPLDIALTPLGSDQWVNDFERPQGFEVLDRYMVTIPTDGVDIEEGVLICKRPNAFAEREQRVMEQKAQLAEAIHKRVANCAGRGHRYSIWRICRF